MRRYDEKRGNEEEDKEKRISLVRWQVDFQEMVTKQTRFSAGKRNTKRQYGRWEVDFTEIVIEQKRGAGEEL